MDNLPVIKVILSQSIHVDKLYDEIEVLKFYEDSCKNGIMKHGSGWTTSFVLREIFKKFYLEEKLKEKYLYGQRDTKETWLRYDMEVEKIKQELINLLNLKFEDK